MLSVVSAALRLVLFLLLTLAFLPVYGVALARGRGYRKIGCLYWRLVGRWSLLARVVVRGDISLDRPLVMVSNHASYLDIVFIGGQIPGVFVAKSEVRGWPGIGHLARLAGTVFVERTARAVSKHRDEIVGRLAHGEPLILFPEGTTSDGNRVLPFKSALFNVAERSVEGQPVRVQPFVVAYTRVGGLPMGYAQRPFYAWIGDEELAPHLWSVMCRGRFTVEITFLPAVTVADFANRKTLATYCEAEVRRGLAGLLTGRERERTPIPAR